MKNSNKLAQRRAAKQRAEEYRAARNEPGADKGKLKRQFHKDKRGRRQDEKAKTQINLSAWQRKNQQKRYDEAVAGGTMKSGEHQDFINKTGAFDEKRVEAHDKYKKRKRGYARKPGSLAAMLRKQRS